MTANLVYDFVVGEQRFTFDGSSLSIFEVLNDKLPCGIQSTRKEDRTHDKDAFFRSLALNLINRCNLSCSYCYAGGGKYDHPGVKMSFDIARKSVDMVIDSVVKNRGDSMTVAFFGGEPLLADRLMREVVSYIKANVPSGIKVKYLITTNGTLLTSELVEFMKNNNFQVTISLDGNKEAHNRNRHYPDEMGTYDEVVGALRLLTNSVPLTARITLSDTNPMIDLAVKHILSLGVKRITYALDYNMGDHAFKLFMSSLDELFLFSRDSILCGKYFDITNITEPIVSLVLKRKKRSHCNAGVSYLSVSAEGNIYRCPRFTGNPNFILGDLTRSGEQIENAMSRFRASLKDNAGERSIDCASCPFVHLCGGVCYHQAFSLLGSEFSAVPRECVYRQKLFGLVLSLLSGLSVFERRDYLLFLNRLWQKGGDVDERVGLRFDRKGA